MKKYLLAAVAAAAIASPAAARDHSGYVGLEGGFLFPTNNNVFVDASDSYYCDLGGVAAEAAAVDFSNCVGDFHTKYKTGYDVDVVAGYDFGMFRLEGELGYKRASHKHYSLGGESISSNGHTSAWSAMVNGLVDFGGDSGVNFSIGGGVGYAHTRYRFGIDETDAYFDPLSTTLSRSRFAWQLLAEARVPVSQQIDVGVKYRYFNAGRLRHTFDDGEGGTIFASTKFHSHSILASLIYNFAPPAPPPPGPPPPPPPPPPAPATQTCPDGSVIEATATCPLPPPPPPPPPPATSGERGQ